MRPAITRQELADALNALREAAMNFKHSTTGSWKTPECQALDDAADKAAHIYDLCTWDLENGR